MREAIAQAHIARELNEVPVGAVVVLNGEIIGKGYNRSIIDSDPSAHAEMLALRDAAKSINNYRILDASLYVTLEPCLMCSGAMIHARIKRVIYGASDPKTGVINSQMNIFAQEFINHRPEVSRGVLAEECGGMLTSFFKQRRKSS